MSTKIIGRSTASKNAITRRLSPMEQTAGVAGLKSTHDGFSGVSPEDVYNELSTREIDKKLQSGVF